MPNFKCKYLKKLNLPFEKEGLCFEWMAQNEKIWLIYTSFNQQGFFLQLSKNDKNEFVIQGEKHSKPEQIGALQKALLVFRDEFCKEIISEAFALKSNRLITKSSIIQKDLEGLEDKFKAYDGVFLEIGFGSGRHLLYQARKNPRILMLGVEIYNPSIEQVAKLAKTLNNVLLIKSDARLLLAVLSARSLNKIFLHFPIPWHKQEGRRVISKDFAQNCLRVLKIGGEFNLRTDSKDYLEQARMLFSQLNSKLSLAKNENLDIISKYESRWKRQNKDIYDLYVLCEELNFNEEDSNENLSPHNKNSNILNNSEFLNEVLNKNLEILNETLSFLPQKLAKIQKKFCNQPFRGEDFFYRFEALYFIDEKNLLLKLAFGAFDKPDHSYLLLGEKSKFLFKKPFLTKENIKALQRVQEFLCD